MKKSIWEIVDKFDQECIFNLFKPLSLISKSSRSTLFKVILIDDPKERVYACKKYKMNRITPGSDEIIEEKTKQLLEHMKLVQKLIHPHIIRFYKLFINQNNTLYILMEYMPLGSLFDYLERQKKPLDERLARIWFSQILGAISYIHSMGMAHRNLNLKAIMLRSNDSVVLSGFYNHCLAFKLDSDIMRKTITNESNYQAPEMHLFSSQIWPYNAKSADMYALGVCLFQMLNYDPPFGQLNMDGKENNQINYIIKQRQRQYHFNEQYDSLISKNMKDFISKLLEPRPGMRITANSALLHVALDHT